MNSFMIFTLTMQMLGKEEWSNAKKTAERNVYIGSAAKTADPLPAQLHLPA